MYKRQATTKGGGAWLCVTRWRSKGTTPRLWRRSRRWYSMRGATAAIVLDAGWPLTAGERPGRMPVDDAAVRAALGAPSDLNRGAVRPTFVLISKDDDDEELVGNYASPR